MKNITFFANIEMVGLEFYLDFLCFHLCSVGLNIAECVIFMLRYYCWNYWDDEKVLVATELFCQYLPMFVAFYNENHAYFSWKFPVEAWHNIIAKLQ